jgi:hypothetical protein
MKASSFNAGDVIPAGSVLLLSRNWLIMLVCDVEVQCYVPRNRNAPYVILKLSDEHLNLRKFTSSNAKSHIAFEFEVII